MAKVEIVTHPISGSSHVEQDECSILFTSRVYVNDVLIKGESPEYKAWVKRGQDEEFEEEPTVSLDLGDGAGFLRLTIRHADKDTWAMLRSLPDDEYAFGSTRKEFWVFVTELAHRVESPSLVTA